MTREIELPNGNIHTPMEIADEALTLQSNAPREHYEYWINVFYRNREWLLANKWQNFVDERF